MQQARWEKAREEALGRGRARGMCAGMKALAAIGLVGTLVVGPVYLFGWHSTPQIQAAISAASAESPQSPPTLRLLKCTHHTVDVLGFSHIGGVAVNDTGRDLAYAQIVIRLVDRSGAQVGTALANTNNLPAGARWRFEAMGAAEGFRCARDAKFTGF